MRVFTVDARYARFVTANLALTLAEVQRDKDRREDEDQRVQKLATVPDQFIDDEAEGTLTIVVGVENHEEAASEAFAAGARS